jgi:putative peptidoglycan lipid II flippase
MRRTLMSSLVMVLALTIPATAGLILLAEPIIRLIFEHGAFTAADTLATSRALALYSVGLFAYSSNKVLVPAFYALDKTRYPVIASFIAIGTNLLLINLTIDTYQHLAIALSTSVTMMLNFVFLGVVLHLKMAGLPLRYFVTGCFKILCATAVMTCVVVAGKSLLSPWLVGTVVQQLCSVFLIIGTAAAIYGILINWMKLSEFSEIVKKVRSKLGR